MAAKKVMRYLQRMKDYMFVYRKVDNLEIIGYSDSYFAGFMDDMKSTSGMSICLLEEMFHRRVSNRLL